MKNKLHIIALNIPYPPNYGGVIDIFYKIKYLHKNGFDIFLHCYKYDRPGSKELNKYCKSVFYYERKKRIIDAFSTIPFIVKTRNNSNLIGNIEKDPAPILFEGIHTCFYLDDERLSKFPKIVRTHNIEHDYYKKLSESTKSIFKKLFFTLEAKKLKLFENKLNSANSLICISPNDTNYFKSKFNNATYIPAFHPYEKVLSKQGKGEYILFHGNLGVPENEKAILFIINEVLNNSPHKLIVAGKEPSVKIRNKIASNYNWSIIENPSENEMFKLIQEAHICLIPTFQATGLKLKLLASLFVGRFVVTNNEMVSNTGLESLCLIGNTASQLLEIINKTMTYEFFKAIIENRKTAIDYNFSNQSSTEKLIQVLNKYQQ